jgi:hypothetical protein
MTDRIAAIGAALDDTRTMVADLRELNPGDPDDRHDLKCVHSYLNWCITRINNIEERNTQ